MYAFIMHVLILLPPINAVQAAHPLTSFTIQSTPSYVGFENCSKGVDATGDYITSQLPENVKIHIEADCSIPETVES